ncbi:MAG: Carboxypeptidase regulatory-like domain [Solirubrobacteraceae bacterium]|jgi:hypothetical protein|nr:Carboxypeptidase regulatory-like domain [Solirubrobacteraceae bacterium]
MHETRLRPAGLPPRTLIAIAGVLLALAATLIAFGVVAPSAGAQTTDGAIIGRVTDSGGRPIPDITVAAVPVGGDTIVSTKTKADGTYVLILASGTYDVGFNAQVVAKINLSYQTVIFGGPGPGPNENCTVCGGAPVSVAPGVVTPDVNGALPPGQSSRTGIRPLSGNTIGLVNGRISFKLGCHEDPSGCHGTANLHLGGTSGPIVASAKVSIRPSEVAVIHFKIPPSVRGRLQRAGTRGLQATVAVTTAHGRSITHFKLRA